MRSARRLQRDARANAVLYVVEIDGHRGIAVQAGPELARRQQPYPVALRARRRPLVAPVVKLILVEAVAAYSLDGAPVGEGEGPDGRQVGVATGLVAHAIVAFIVVADDVELYREPSLAGRQYARYGVVEPASP